ncbi:uncharacterized protein [Littorina saxatilis]|uniref:uncharacterized protein isoform X3 n=1 Tax=Littorina saxatilis TaxID=31220 RepID=UPI0038B4CF51
MIGLLRYNDQSLSLTCKALLTRIVAMAGKEAEKRLHETDDELTAPFEHQQKVKSKKYMQKWKDDYYKLENMEKSTKGPHFAHCGVCHRDFSISHGGRNDITKHCASSTHKEAYWMEGEDPAVKTEVKIEIDVAEEPPQSWFMTQQHTHVLTTAPCTEACKANVDALRVQVKDLQAKVTSLEARQRELEGELVASYATQDVENHSPPSGRQKPGCHSPATAAAHHMVELDPGSGVFCYPSNLIEAKGKSGDAMPRYLISVFYTTNQLVEAGNLSGTNGKQGLDKRIVDAIVSYTLANNEGSSSARVRTVLRSKLSAAICRYQKLK